MPGYRHARNAYWRLFNREQYVHLLRERERLRRFVRRGALAFDVGANVGDVTSLLLDLGARVIAVEPNPELASLVSRRFRVATEAVALGACEGGAQLHLGRDHGHSTLSSEWAALNDSRFVDSIPVPVTTLDVLIERHSRPEFVKLDVEGYEAEVLAGLSVAIPALSFEFQRGLLDVTERSLERLVELGSYRFQFTSNSRLGSSDLAPDRPTDTGRLLARLSELPDHTYGDVYATLAR
jgi:FkbM family methyltransferase